MSIEQTIGAWLMFAAGFAAAIVATISAALIVVLTDGRCGIGGRSEECRQDAGLHGWSPAPPQEAAGAGSKLWWDCFNETEEKA